MFIFAGAVNPIMTESSRFDTFIDENRTDRIDEYVTG